MTAVFLEKLTWPEAEKCFQSDAIFVIPLGAALKEHGRHLPLNNDKLIAIRLTEEIGKRLDITVLPVVETSYYPAFAEYPGSISFDFETSCAIVRETCAGLAAFGCRKIYVLNTGFSTMKVLARVQECLKTEHPQLQFSYTDFKNALEGDSRGLCRQEGGGHADEVETSMMLVLAPEIVALENAEPDYHGDKSGPLTRCAEKADEPDSKLVYSPTGAWGDPTLATREKGEAIVNALLDWIEKDLRSF